MDVVETGRNNDKRTAGDGLSIPGKEAAAGFSGDIEISVSGDGFLYNMVRIIVGTLVDIGLGKMVPGR